MLQTCSEEDFVLGKHCYSRSQASKNAVSKDLKMISVVSSLGFGVTDLHLSPTVPFCRGAPEPDRHDEHLDSAERNSSCNCD